MTGHLLYPRLERSSAARLRTALLDLSLPELHACAGLTHPDAAPAATGGHAATENEIAQVQRDIRLIAEEAGYPRPLRRGQEQAFDRPCGTALLESMAIVPADAADEGVWSFLSLVVTPEIPAWRFPGGAEERYLGRPRNVLRRLWWRAFTLGPDLDRAPDGCQPLGEDEFVQILERPSLGGNLRTARTLRDAVWAAERVGLATARSELMRQLTRRLRAEKSHIALEALTSRQLVELASEITSASHKDLTGTALEPTALLDAWPETVSDLADAPEEATLHQEVPETGASPAATLFTTAEERTHRRSFGRLLAETPDGAIEYRVHGVTHRARVSGNVIVIEDGRRFESPSGAARAVNGGKAVNGWMAWTRDGRSLASWHDND